MAERKRLDLGNLNPIYERELNKLDVHQVKGRWISKDREGGKGCHYVGISNGEGRGARAHCRGRGRCAR